MFRDLLKISLLGVSLVFSACQTTGSGSSNPGGLTKLLGDDTPKAIELVNEANNYLRDVKKIYKENQGRSAELKEALSPEKRDLAKVKTITGELVFQINDGLVLGAKAIQKIDEAKSLDINSDFRDYLSLKQESLQKFVDAFELRRQTAKSLSENITSTDPASIKKISDELKDKNESFEKLIDEGQKLSIDANDLVKATLKKKQ